MPLGHWFTRKPARRVRIGLEQLEHRDTPTFMATPPTGFTNGLDRVEVIAVGDFNGDGKADVAVGARPIDFGLPASVQILLGNGDGTFANGQLIDLPDNTVPTGLVAFDADQDGQLDLAATVLSGTTQFTGGTVVLRGNGNGTFTQTFIDNRNALGITTGLYDADNLPDLVTISAGGGYQVFRNAGGGNFTAGANGVGTLNVRRLVSGDFDGDGKLDFAGLNQNSDSQILAYYGAGNGTFSDPGSTVVVDILMDIVAADFDGDGLTDVVVSTSSGDALLYRGTAGRTFTTPGVRIDPASASDLNLVRLATGDLNGDGLPDLVSLDQTGTARVAFNAGGGTFTADTPPTYASTGGGGLDVAIGEFDGDSNTDFVTIYQDELTPPSGQVWLNAAPDPTTTTITAAPNPSTVGTAVTLTATVTLQNGLTGTPTGTVTFIVDGTAQTPVALVNGTATLTLTSLTVGSHPVSAQYSGGAAFEPSTSQTIQVTVNAPALILAGSDNGAVICLFSPDATLRGTVAGFEGFTGVRPAAGDVTGDGYADIIVGSGPTDPSRVAVVDGQTQQVLATFSPFGDEFTGGVFVTAGDINGDGIADLAVSADNGGGSRVRVFLSQGGGFVPVADFLALDDPNFRGGVRIALGDVNGDGFADLIAAAGPGGGARVAGFDGLSLTQGQAVHLFHDFFAFDPNSRVGAFVAAGDINGDGFAEVVVGAAEGGAPRVTVFDGQLLTGGTQQVVANYFAGPETNRGGIRVAVRDYDSDGFADIITGPGGQDGSTQRVFSGESLAAGGSEMLLERDPFPGLNAGIYTG